MPITRIYSPNFVNQIAQITFYPVNGGGPINLGTHMLPYNYNSNDYYGTYQLYFPEYGVTCYFTIEPQVICNLTFDFTAVVIQ